MAKPKKVVGVYDRPEGNNRTRMVAIVVAVLVVIAGVVLLAA